MARSSLLALCLVLAACSSSVVPTPVTRPARTFAPSPFDPVTLRYPVTAAAFIGALNEGREADALGLIDEHFTFGIDCDYANRRLWYMTDREAAAYWLHLRIADHDRIDIVRSLDGGTYTSALRFEVRRSSDSIRGAGYPGGAIQPRANLVLRFNVEGSQVVQWVWEFGNYPPLVTPFPDCMP